MNEEEYFEQLCSNSVDGTLTDSEKQKLEELWASGKAPWKVWQD